MNPKKLSPYQLDTLDNEICPYCGTLLGIDATEDHVIGRRFVPIGTLHRSGNVRLKSCPSCNNHKKSRLENDISAITMQPDAWGGLACDDKVLRAESSRKISSESRLTGKPVSKSAVEEIVNISFNPQVNFSFRYGGPPQLHPERVFELARLQLCGFAYWMSFDKKQRRGKWLPGVFKPLQFAYRGDWGNPAMLAFMNLVADWTDGLVAVFADGFFKVAIRQDPTSPCWSWAFEWNRNVRVFGFNGENPALDELLSMIPSRGLSFLAKRKEDGEEYIVRTRREMPLEEREDKLFVSQSGKERRRM